MERYSNIRQLIGHMIGQTLVDITQHDREDFPEEGSFVMLHFDKGDYIKFPIGEDGFHHSEEV